MVRELNFTEKVPISHHLREIKDRLIIVAIVLLAIFALCFYYVQFLIFWLEDPLPKQYSKLVFISPTEPFFTNMKVAFMGALFVTMPLILYHIWQFVGPGLKVREKKITMLFVFFGTLFFVGGGMFCYFLVLPIAIKFLFTYGTEYWNFQVTIGLYFTFVTKLLLAFAFAFQTPLIMVLLTKFGAINTIKMRLYRKWAFLGAFALAAVLTPPDIITQILLGVPLYGLYEFGVLVSSLFEDPKQRDEVLRQLQKEREMQRARKKAADAATADRTIRKNIKTVKKKPGNSEKRAG